MLRISALTLAFFFAAISTAPATPRCSEPYAPQVPNGRTATLDELNAARRDARAFIAASDVYQECLLESPTSPRREALLDANQAQKERIGSAVNAAIAAFNARHTEQAQLSSR